MKAFEVSVLPETFALGGSADRIYATVDTSAPAVDGEMQVSIHVDGAQDLKSVYIALSYDQQQYHAVSLLPTKLMGSADKLLSLYMPTGDNSLEYGQVMVHPESQTGFSGSGVLALASFSAGPESPGRSVSNNGPNMTMPSQVTNLAFDGSDLTWTYAQQGDYDQNGETNIADLTPIAMHYQQVSPGGPGTPWPLPVVESQIDGDNNGEINIADITPIGLNFQRDTSGGFNMFRSSDFSDYPAGNPPTGVNGEGSTELTVAPESPLLVTDAVNYDARITERLVFVFNVSSPIADDFYWVRPADLTDTLGISSNPSSGIGAPTVSSTVPADGESDVAININPTATFSQTMNPATITNATFTLMDGAAPVAGSVTYTGVTATFRPDSLLAANTSYTATITTGAQSSGGTALAADYVWTFTTGTSADDVAPTVSSTVPANAATEVPLNENLSATFSEAMDPLTITNASFTLTEGLTLVSGTVSYAGVTASFAPDADLLPNTEYTATITTAATDLAGNPLAADYVWTFQTGVALDDTRPTVIITAPLDGEANVAINVKPSATFSEPMDPLTISTATFLLMHGVTPVSGSVSYAGVTATFTPSSNLLSDTMYTGIITENVQDLAGNTMVTDYIWSFQTGALLDSGAPTVESTDPANGDLNVPAGSQLSATFSEPMNPLTITNVTFTLKQGLIPISGSVTYLGLVATFTPDVNLDTDTVYTATVTTGAEDLAGNAMLSDYVWTFRTAIVDLGEADHFGSFGGGAGMTNQGIFTVINGDIGTTGASTMITGFHDTGGNIFTETPLNIGTVNGTIFTAPPPPGDNAKFIIATQAAADAQLAYASISPASMPGGSDPGAGQLGGLTLFPGVYMAAGGTFQITGSDLTLDGQGDPNAVWVFQTAATLTVGDSAPRNVILINGADAKNVYWYVGSAATINGAGGGTMVGTIIAASGITFSTAGNVVLTVLEGRAIGLNASVTMVNTVINIPQ